MKKVKTAQELKSLQEEIQNSRDPEKPCITICAGTGCVTYGSQKLVDNFRAEIEKQNLNGKVEVRASGCHGFCERGPLVVINPQNIFYQRVGLDDAEEIIKETVLNGQIIDRLLYIDPVTKEKILHEDEIPFYKRQMRLVFGMNGNIDPNSLDDYLAIGGYSALIKVLNGMKPEAIIEEIKTAGLRGRGGGGFNMGLKWEATRNAPGLPKYIICNADEGDPGAYMDRSLLEGNPYLILEGMLIGAYAIGSHKGYVYVRNEYPLAVKNITIAVEKARALGILGENILGSGFDFDVVIVRGGGAFVCGEETALISSIEGRSGEPRAKYVFPAERGLYNKPTNINNVETWANVPLIINKGSDWYRSIGTENSKGTKIFALVGKINNTGLVEVPMGITLREIVYDIGGGIP
ncbi:MAG: NAD(P)H-dependent oxidoreductase subunit E, partial [Desulfobacterales bacterium]